MVTIYKDKITHYIVRKIKIESQIKYEKIDIQEYLCINK